MSKLHITSQSVSPNFKIMLFPFQDGQTLPETMWSADHSVATISWRYQADQWTFTQGNDGRTRLKVLRNGSVLI